MPEARLAQARSTYLGGYCKATSPSAPLGLMQTPRRDLSRPPFHSHLPAAAGSAPQVGQASSGQSGPEPKGSPSAPTPKTSRQQTAEGRAVRNSSGQPQHQHLCPSPPRTLAKTSRARRDVRAQATSLTYQHKQSVYSCLQKHGNLHIDTNSADGAPRSQRRSLT